MKKDLIFFGIQASGKGTQSDEIMKYFPSDYAYFGPGLYCRILGSQPNFVGDRVKDVMARGDLFPSEFTNTLYDLFVVAVQNSDKAIIADGYCRNIIQTQHVLEQAKKYNREVLGVYLDLPEEKSIERMHLRKRADDTDEAIKTRLAIYYQETVPAIEYFKAHAQMISINGDQTIEKVYEDLIKIIS